ncbi:MAG: glycoside hydrolase family 5 protein [Candidatus Falkowbacteria bacterium]
MLKKVSLIIIFIVVAGFGLMSAKTGLKAGWFDFLFTSKDILSISGNKIFFNKEEVWLTGVAMGDPHSRVEIDRRTTADYEAVKKDWHANTVRLSIHPGVFKRDLDDMKEILEDEVAAARAQGLYVIIDWHVIGMPNGWFKPSAYGEDHYYNYDSNFNTAKEFWEMMAVKYRGDRGVMFELWNEPADQKTNEWENLRPYMERLYEIIRSQGASNVIIVPGVWWTYDLRGIKDNSISGENIAYNWHNYEANGRYLIWSQALDGLNEVYPIIVTEWGYETDPTSSYNVKSDYPEKFKQFILDKGLHFTAWCWHAKWKPRMFQSDWETLSDYGEFIKSFLAELDIKKQIGGGMSQIKISNQVDNFIKFGVDDNSKKLGEGERAAVIYSFQKAYARLPQSEGDMADVARISNGFCPWQKNLEMEKWAMNEFCKIYLRPARLSESHDYMAVMVMAYGLRQKAENRNLTSEVQSLKIFKDIYKKLPHTTEEWNIMQAITYSGARR